MAKIVVFDSGLGSISVIKPIRKIINSELIYFADQKNFPYGTKTKTELEKIIKSTINFLDKKFSPDLIVIGSNTPTLVLKNLTNQKILGVLPPLKQAVKITRTKNIAILASQLVVKSNQLSKFIKKYDPKSKTTVTKINANSLIQLVESGKFLINPKASQKIIIKILQEIISKNNIDVITLSSTHLPFLLSLLQKEFPNVTFLDPAEELAKKIATKLAHKKSNKNKIQIYTSKNPKILENQLKKLGIKHKVNFLSLE